MERRLNALKTRTPQKRLQCNLHTNDLSFPKQTFTVLLYILHLILNSTYFFFESYTSFMSPYDTPIKNIRRKPLTCHVSNFFICERRVRLGYEPYFRPHITQYITPRFTQLNRNILLFFIVMIRRALLLQQIILQSKHSKWLILTIK